MIVWDDQYSTGVDYIDKQHQNLIEHFNNFVDSVHQGRGRIKIGEMLGYLQFYTEWHFKREESCMHDHKCPVAQDNIEAHNYFKTKLDQMSTYYFEESDTDIGIIYDLIDELSKWIVNHILRIDGELRHCGVTPAYAKTQEMDAYQDDQKAG